MTAALLLLAATAVAAPPNVTALLPSGCQVGQSAEVTAQGALGDKPQAWVSRDGVKIECAETGNKFKVIVAPETAPGVCWLRFFNAEGASPLRPFVISTLPDVLEKEPNNALSESQRIDFSSVVHGVLEKTGDVDTYAMPLKAGQTLVASVTAQQTLGSPMDAVLQVVGPRGFVLEHNEDTHGLDPQIVFKAPADGDYAVRLFAFPSQPDSSVNFHGGANYIYRLTLTTGPFVDHVLPMCVAPGATTNVRLQGWNIPAELAELPITPNGSTAELSHKQLANALVLPVASGPHVVEAAPNEAGLPQELSVPSSVTGRIAKPDEVDVFRVRLAAKQILRIDVDARVQGSLLDPVIRFLKPDGSVQQEVDDSSRGTADPEMTVTAAAEGEYRVEITDLFRQGGEQFFYRLSVATPEPDFELTVAADAFVLTADKPLEIPVTIQRQRGSKQDLIVAVSGLPPGVTAEPVTSAGQGDSAKSVKLVLKSEKPETAANFSGPIRISGRDKTEPPVEKSASAALANLGVSTGHHWLTVIAPPAK